MLNSGSKLGDNETSVQMACVKKAPGNKIQLIHIADGLCLAIIVCLSIIARPHHNDVNSNIINKESQHKDFCVLLLRISIA